MPTSERATAVAAAGQLPGAADGAPEPPSEAGPIVRSEAVRFRVPDADRSLRGVRVRQELRRPRDEPALVYDEATGCWEAELPRPAVDRMEYQLELEHADGGSEVLPDPFNPGPRADGAFGEKSVVTFPEYRPPAWLGALDAPVPGTVQRWTPRVEALRADVPIAVWSPPDIDVESRVPLLVVHDGPELARFGGLLHLLAVAVADGRVPPHRVALLTPVDRDETYSASAAYAKAMANEVLPLLDWLAPIPEGSPRVGLGASLGALAMLHLHRRSVRTFGGLVLHSGSYFRQRFDAVESGFPRFRRISRFVGQVLAADDAPAPIPVLMTCGLVEENLANNRAVAAALGRQGYDVRLVEHRDAHNWISWRDTWDPHLLDHLRRCWS